MLELKSKARYRGNTFYRYRFFLFLSVQKCIVNNNISLTDYQWQIRYQNQLIQFVLKIKTIDYIYLFVYIYMILYICETLPLKLKFEFLDHTLLFQYVFSLIKQETHIALTLLNVAYNANTSLHHLMTKKVTYFCTLYN